MHSPTSAIPQCTVIDRRPLIYLFIHPFSFHSDFLLKVVFIIKPWQLFLDMRHSTVQSLCRMIKMHFNVCERAFAWWKVFIKTIIIIMVLLCTYCWKCSLLCLLNCQGYLCVRACVRVRVCVHVFTCSHISTCVVVLFNFIYCMCNCSYFHPWISQPCDVYFADFLSGIHLNPRHTTHTDTQLRFDGPDVSVSIWKRASDCALESL